MAQPGQRLQTEGDFLCLLPGKEITVPLEALSQVAVITRDSGPVEDDVALAVYWEDTALVVPSRHESYQELYDVLSARLPLDNEAYIQAMCCAENNLFPLWEREQG